MSRSDSDERPRKRRRKRRRDEWGEEGFLDLVWHRPKRWLLETIDLLIRSPFVLVGATFRRVYELLEFLFHALLTWPIRILVATFSAWRQSARLKFLLAGLPALLLMIAVICLAALIKSPTDLTPRYYVQAIQTLASGDYDTSRIYHDRLLEIQGPNSETLFNLVHISEQLGDDERVAVLMANLAPLDQAVHGPAHLRRAKELMANPGNDIAAAAKAERHLRHAIRVMPQSSEPPAELGRLLLMLGRPVDAIELLEPIVEERPSYLLMFAQALVFVGERNEALIYGRMAEQHYKQVTQSDPGNRAARIEWARATSFLEDFPRALQILENGVASAEDPKSYREAILGLYITWFDYLLREEPKNTAAMFRVLDSALEVSPNETALFQRIMSVLQAGGESADEMRDRMNQLLADGENTPLIHVVLGTDAGKQGNYELAVKHLEIAVRQDPKMLYAANNLAWYLAHKGVPDLDTAYTLIDVVVQRWPEHAFVLDTRGQILAKQGKYEEALIDLKKALPGLPDYGPIHVTLAHVYRQLGLEDLANRHQAKADELRAKEQGPPNEA